MGHNWIKFIYERDAYVIDLDRISTFACTGNGRLIFWLPDGKVQIVIHRQTHPDAYQQILNYVEQSMGQALSKTFKV